MPRLSRRLPAPPTAVDLLLQELGSFTEDITRMGENLRGVLDPLDRLRAIHDAASTLGMARSAFADVKGLACLEANEAGSSYPQIAAALHCSEPYVQQMTYRGRRVRSEAS